MTEPAHYKRGPSGASRWLICTASPEAEEGYPDETTDAADEGTAAHWLLEQCLKQGKSVQEFLETTDTPEGVLAGVVPAGEVTGCLKQWPITGEMIEAVQLHIDEVEKYSKKRGTRLFVEERVFIPPQYGLADTVGGTADTILYLPKSKTLIVLDFKYGKGHVVEVDDKRWGVNPQIGLYVLAVLGELDRLLGKKNYGVKWIVAGVVQPRAYHKKGQVRTKKLAPHQLMDLEIDLIQAVNGEKVRVAGDHCHFCRAKPDCEEHHRWRHDNAIEGFEADMPEAIAAGHAGDDYPEYALVAPALDAPADPNVVCAPKTEPEVPALVEAGGLLSRPVKGLTRQELATARGLANHVKAWAKEVEEEVRTRLLHDIDVPGAKLAQGKGSRAYGGTPAELQTAITLAAGELGVENADLHVPRELKSPAQLEKEFGKAKFKTTPLAALVVHKAGGPVVVDADSDKPDYVKDNGFEAEAPEEKPIESPLL